MESWSDIASFLLGGWATGVEQVGDSPEDAGQPGGAERVADFAPRAFSVEDAGGVQRPQMARHDREVDGAAAAVDDLGDRARAALRREPGDQRDPVGVGERLEHLDREARRDAGKRTVSY